MHGLAIYKAGWIDLVLDQEWIISDYSTTGHVQSLQTLILKSYA
jgi:hypothetical protein